MKLNRFTKVLPSRTLIAPVSKKAAVKAFDFKYALVIVFLSKIIIAFMLISLPFILEKTAKLLSRLILGYFQVNSFLLELEVQV